MRKAVIGALLVAMCAAIAPARAADGYANAVQSASNNVFFTEKAIGAADGQSATFNGNGTYLILDMGEGEEGTGNLVLTIPLAEIGARATVEFQNAELNTISSVGDYVTSGTWTATFTGDEPYRYARITSTTTKEWTLDAVETASYSTPVVDDEPVDEPEEEDDEIVDYVFPSAGDLIKSPEFSSVYLLGSDGKRHAFPNETVFFSWGYSFDHVGEVSPDMLAGYTLGGNVTIKPGTHLVKLQTNPKTYAVAPGGELRWITSESVAISLYGADWADLVVDVNDAFWPNYTVGENIDEAADIEGWEIEESAY